MSVSEADVLSLSASYDIIAIGMRADEARRERHGTRTTFVRVASVDVAPGAAIRVSPVAGEVRIAGTPTSLVAALDRVREVAAVVGRTPLSGFSLADLEQLAAREQVTLRAVLEALQAAGLELVADAPYDALRDARRSIEEVNIGGLALARLTFHQLPAVDTVSVLKDIAALQRAVGVIRAFAPLPRRMNPLAPTTGYDDVKRVALARLVVDNVPSIQVDWSLYGPKLAQVALTVGADDLDGVSIEEDTGEGSRRTPLEEVRRNIRAAGLEPVERNGRFDPVAR
jgi:aminodeoxyfutalosine synthase